MATHVNFAPNRELPFVFGDLFQISSKLSHYRLGGIQQIASVISGQYLEKKEIHEESQQSDWFEEKERLSERESSTMESTHEGMQQTLAETMAKSQKFSGSLEAEGKFGKFRVAASLSYDNDQSKSQSKTSATEFARDVVTQSRELMRERTLSSRRQSTNVLDRTENVRGFDNRGGTSSAFISRYVEEVHEFSLVQHEAHLFTTFYLPFPAANYLNALEAGVSNAKVGRDDPAKLSYVINAETGETATLSPKDISLIGTDPKHWFKLAAIFGLTDPTPPPADMAEAVALVATPEELGEGRWAMLTGSVKVPEGYRTQGVTIRTEEHTYTTGDGKSDWQLYMVEMIVGKHKVTPKRWNVDMQPSDKEVEIKFEEEIESGEIPFVLHVAGLNRGAFTCYFRFSPTTVHLAKWQLQFFEELKNAQSGKGSGPDMLAGVSKVEVADLRSSPTAAEAVIKEELRRDAVRLITGSDLLGFESVDRTKDKFPLYPVMDVDKINDLQPVYSFLSEGFDFDKMSFTFLPTWLGTLHQRGSAYGGGPTGMMTEFLKASAAKIVMPVRTGREEQLFFFLHTGIIFDGSDVPLPDDPIVLALYDEILEARALNQSPHSITIDTWEEYLPTPHILLQDGATLPDFRPDAPPDPGGVAGNALSPKPA